MSTTRERRLKITPGEVRAMFNDPAFINWEIRSLNTVICTMGIDMAMEEEQANARLYADAHNTANACDMLPSEILAKLREAEKDRDFFRTLSRS